MNQRKATTRLFVTDWKVVAASTEMSEAIARWRNTSNGAIQSRDAHELVATIEDGSNSDASRAASSWLLFQDEPLTRRVLIQACRVMVFEEIRKSGFHNSFDPNFEAKTAAIVLAVGEVSGRSFDWPMRRIRSQFIRESIQLSKERQQPGNNHAEELADLASPEHVDHALELSRLLKQAVQADRISEIDAQIVWRTTIGGVSPAEVAKEMCVAPSSVRKRRERARQSVATLVTA